MDKCRRCPAQILWAINDSTGRPMPVDAAPDPRGNVKLRDEPIETDGRRYQYRAAVLNREQAAIARTHGFDLHLNHFATCPRAASFARKAAAHG